MTTLRKLRLERGLTLPELADFIGLAQPTLVNWELGRFTPRRPLARARLEALFGRSVDELLTEERRPDPLQVRPPRGIAGREPAEASNTFEST
jgi:transcriptional regulator with XRE-family HTH domain